MKIFLFLSLWTGTKFLKDMSKYEFSVMHGRAKVNKNMCSALNLENWTPIARDDTHRGSNAMKQRWAYQGWCKRCVGQARPQGRNGYGAWQKNIKEGGIGIYRSCKKENRWTVAAAQRRAAFRKTQTPSANSLTERPPKRKISFLWI